MKSTKTIGMIAYTEYSRDPRVRRYAEALASSGFVVDCFVLKSTKRTTTKTSRSMLCYKTTFEYRNHLIANRSDFCTYQPGLFPCRLKIELNRIYQNSNTQYT